MGVGQDLLNVPFPEMVESLGMAIARAQTALDMHSVKMAQVMSGSQWIDEDEDGNEVVREGVKVLFGGRLLSLMELGFTPTFYQFVDTVIEVKISVSMKTETEERRSSSSTNVNTSARASVGWFSASASASLSVSTVSASFAAKNSYSSEGASLIRTKLVPLPPPPILLERIKVLMEEQKKTQLSLDLGIVELVRRGTVDADQHIPLPGDLNDIVCVSSKTACVAAEYDTTAKKIKISGLSDGVATIIIRAKQGSNAVSGAFKVVVKTEPDGSGGIP